MAGYVAKARHRQMIVDKCDKIVFFSLEASEEVLLERLEKRKKHFFGAKTLHKALQAHDPLTQKHYVIDAKKPVDEISIYHPSNKRAIVDSVSGKLETIDLTKEGTLDEKRNSIDRSV